MKERESFPTIEYLTKTKEDAMMLLTEAEEVFRQARVDIGTYKMVISECDKEVARQQTEKREIRAAMGSAHTRVMVALVVITILVLLTICSCSKVLKSAGYAFGAVSDGAGFVGQHLIETGENKEKK